jgi:DnaJ-class molecular chaperone
VGAHQTRADFRKALRNAALSLHPDRNPGCSELATRAFMEFQGSIATLERAHENEMVKQMRRATNVSITRTVTFVSSVVVALLAAVGALIAVVLG